MSSPIAPPDGFLIGHWTDHEGVTGCTAVIAPPGARAGVDVRGGGPGTRETDVIGPLAGTSGVTAVLLTGSTRATSLLTLPVSIGQSPGPGRSWARSRF